MASSSTSTSIPSFLCNNVGRPSCRAFTRHSSSSNAMRNFSLPPRKTTAISAKLSDQREVQYRKLGDSDFEISEITLGTMTFGEQNTEKEGHDMLNYAVECGINALDTSEAPILSKNEAIRSWDEAFV